MTLANASPQDIQGEAVFAASEFEKLCQWDKAAQCWLRAGITTNAGRCFQAANRWQQAAACYETTGEWEIAASCWENYQSETNDKKIG